MNAPDILHLRREHCRAETCFSAAQYHLAMKHYRICLELAERREDVQATQFFALKLAQCYSAMNLQEKAAQFWCLARVEG